MSLASYRAAPPRAISGSGCPGGPLYRITIFGPATRSRILSHRFFQSVVGHRPTTNWPRSKRRFRRTPATPPPSHSSAAPVVGRSPHPHTRRYSGPRTRHPRALSRRRARHKASRESTTVVRPVSRLHITTMTGRMNRTIPPGRQDAPSGSASSSSPAPTPRDR